MDPNACEGRERILLESHPLARFPSLVQAFRSRTGGNLPGILTGLVKILISFNQCLGAISAGAGLEPSAAACLAPLLSSLPCPRSGDPGSS